VGELAEVGCHLPLVPSAMVVNVTAALLSEYPVHELAPWPDVNVAVQMVVPVLPR
jgi:hypothetical protein